MKKYFVSYIYRYKNGIGMRSSKAAHCLMEHEDITDKPAEEVIRLFEQKLFAEKEKAALRTWNTPVEVVILSYPYEVHSN